MNRAIAGISLGIPLAIRGGGDLKPEQEPRFVTIPAPAAVTATRSECTYNQGMVSRHRSDPPGPAGSWDPYWTKPILRMGRHLHRGAAGSRTAEMSASGAPRRVTGRTTIPVPARNKDHSGSLGSTAAAATIREHRQAHQRRTLVILRAGLAGSDSVDITAPPAFTRDSPDRGVSPSHLPRIQKAREGKTDVVVRMPLASLPDRWYIRGATRRVMASALASDKRRCPGRGSPFLGALWHQRRDHSCPPGMSILAGGCFWLGVRHRAIRALRRPGDRRSQAQPSAIRPDAYSSPEARKAEGAPSPCSTTSLRVSRTCACLL
jgi:hypothetical protein